MIHLDTSFLVRALVPGTAEDTLLRDWLRSGQSLRLSAICLAEFLCGPLDLSHRALVTQLFREPEPFLQADAATAARLFNLAGRRRGSFVDCMIAATALRLGASLATVNPDDFRRFASEGLDVVTA